MLKKSFAFWHHEILLRFRWKVDESPGRPINIYKTKKYINIKKHCFTSKKEGDE